MSESDRHTAAWEGAKGLVGVFAPLLNESEKIEAFHECYELLRQLLLAYDLANDRRAHRLNPSAN